MPLKTFDTLDVWKRNVNTSAFINLYNWKFKDKLKNTLYKQKTFTNSRTPSTSSNKQLPIVTIEHEELPPPELKEINDKYSDFCCAQNKYRKYHQTAEELVAQCSTTISKESPINSNKHSFNSGILYNNVRLFNRKRKSKRSILVKGGFKKQQNSFNSDSRGSSMTPAEKSKALSDLKHQLKSIKTQMLPLKLYIKQLKLEIYQLITNLLTTQKYPKAISLTWAIRKIWGVGYKFDENTVSNVLDEKSLQYLFSIATLEDKHDKLIKERERVTNISKLICPLKNIKSKIHMPNYNNIMQIMHTYCQTTNRSLINGSSEEGTPNANNSQTINTLKGTAKYKVQLNEITSQLIATNEEIRNRAKQEEGRINKYYSNNANYDTIRSYLFGDSK